MKNDGLDWIREYNGNHPLLPTTRKISGTSVADSIIGMRPNETWSQAVRRHVLEQRVKKIHKIQEKIKGRC